MSAMKMNEVVIAEFTSSQSDILMELLMELHGPYFNSVASADLSELSADHNSQQAFSDYVRFLDENDDDTWKAFIGFNAEKAIGFIIGSFKTDEYLVHGRIGVLEDWFVTEKWRGKGIGKQLYAALERWFRTKECQQVISDTWPGNEISIRAHKELGFFVSGIKFSKKLL